MNKTQDFQKGTQKYLKVQKNLSFDHKDTRLEKSRVKYTVMMS